MGLLDGKVAIVTGGGRGIGRAIAGRLAGEGAAVVVNSATEGSCGAAAEEIRQSGGKAVAVAGDVSLPEVVKTVVDTAVSEFGGLHILVNNAGITRDTLLMRMKEDQWDEVLRINLKSAYLLSQAVLRPMMKNKWGRIINVTSIVGLIGNPGQTNYAASKAGLVGFTKSLAKEVASRNILVNAIAPGFIETAMTGELNAEWKDKLLAEIPQGRFGTVDDIAGPVLFLCSEEAAYITGTCLEVTGGMGM